MAGFRITNCHVHTLTARHTPKLFPSPLLWIFRQVPPLIRLFAALARLFARYAAADTLDRLYMFQTEAATWRQEDIFARLREYYPSGTRFVVLPLDLEDLGHGRVDEPIGAQHDELAEMARDFGDAVIPFATIRPDRIGAVAEMKRAVEQLGFRGIKLYPPLGYAPTHEVLIERVYPFAVEKNLPVMSHCSRGGVRRKGLTRARAHAYTRPQAYETLLTDFPDLRICLAHFGGESDWRAYAREGLPPDDATARDENWQVKIRDMIGSGQYPNLWTDISYTLFHFDDFIPFLRVFLTDESDEGENLRKRVLFGSDFYMTRQEKLSEREVCFRLRNALGEEIFRQIAETNPAEWLGEAPVTPVKPVPPGP